MTGVPSWILNKIVLIIERIAAETSKLNVKSQADTKEPLGKTSQAIQKTAKAANTPPAAKEKKGSLLKGIIYSVISITLLAISAIAIYSGISVYSQKQNLKRKEEPKTTHQSDYNKLRSYVVTQLNRGVSYEQISQTLQNAGWKKEMVEVLKTRL